MRHLYLVLGIIIGVCCALMWCNGKRSQPDTPEQASGIDWDKRIQSLNDKAEEEKYSKRLRR
jgi:hypothetical protein